MIKQNEIEKLTITSSNFENWKLIPLDFTCDGRNLFPELEVSNIPYWAKTLLIYVEDPDAPGGEFIHLMVWNIEIKQDREIITQEVLQKSILWVNYFQNIWYNGPCPPKWKIHHYYFRVFAFSKKLNLKQWFIFEDMTNVINDNVENIVWSGYLLWLYER
jgi:Raf kinase inhibitor-like YbhB/YbcL family protein